MGLTMCFSDFINEISVIWGERAGRAVVPLGSSVPDGNVACLTRMSESGVGGSEKAESQPHSAFP